MASIGIINDQGEEVERRAFSREASVESEATGRFQPSLVQNIKFDNKGQMSTITTECGESENRREGNNKPKITVEGIIREGEIQPLRSLKNEETIRFISDIFEGRVIIERLSITQDTNVIYYKPDGGDEELAFNFQLQLKEP